MLVYCVDSLLYLHDHNSKCVRQFFWDVWIHFFNFFYNIVLIGNCQKHKNNMNALWSIFWLLTSSILQWYFYIHYYYILKLKTRQSFFFFIWNETKWERLDRRAPNVLQRSINICLLKFIKCMNTTNFIE